MKPNVLVVDGNQGMRDQLGRMLALRGYIVRLAADATDAHASLKASRPALVIATVDPPRLDAIALCRSVRDSTGTPVIILSKDEQVETEVQALDAGADDYVVLPLRHESFLARIRALLRRSGVTPEVSAVESGPFHIDFDDRRVRIRGQAVRLTPKEFDLFTFMAKHPNRVLPHKMLLGAVWGPASEEQSEYLRVFVGQLRKKLEPDPARPRHLVTEPWVGYRFNPDGVEQA
jgi:two-component system KDP operon response regulator KdpE